MAVKENHRSYIDLANAYATQHTGQNGKTEWVLFNQDKKEIFSFPKDWTEKQVFFVLNFARKFELDAFNAGINFQKEKSPKEVKMLRDMVQSLQAEKEVWKQENIRIGNKLDELLTSKI
jgi:hypothetical protein